MTDDQVSVKDFERINIKQFRKDNPSGFMELMEADSMKFIIDGLLSAPPRRELNKTDLERLTGVNRNTIREHMPTLTKFKILEPVPGTTPQRYRVNDSGRVLRLLHELNSTLNSVRAGDEVSTDDAPILKRNTERSEETFKRESSQLLEKVPSSGNDDAQTDVDRSEAK
jgi:hypothetical protein